MTLKLTFFDEDGQTLAGGLTLELLEDRDVIAEAQTNDDGEVVFDAKPGEGELSVRVKAEALSIGASEG